MLNLFKKKKPKQEVEEPKIASVSDDVIITEKEIEDFKDEYRRYVHETFKFGDDLEELEKPGDKFICMVYSVYEPDSIYTYFRPSSNSIKLASFNKRGIIDGLKDKKLKK